MGKVAAKPEKMKLLDILAAVLLALLGWAAFASGIFFNALFVFCILMVPLRIATLLWRIFRKSLETRWWRMPGSREMRLHWLQVMNRLLFWLLAALTIATCIVPAQFSPQEYESIRLTLWGCVAVLMALELLPSRRLYPALNAVFFAGSILMAFQLVRIHKGAPEAGGVVLDPPFRGEWLVVQGGDSSLINHHHGIRSQRHALDLVRVVDGRDREGAPGRLDSYFSWDQSIYAPADGTVVKVVDDLADNPIGKLDGQHLAGNFISIDMGNERFVILAHLREKSAEVSEGDRVRVGHLIARCGNSGNTTQPHLHLQVQDQAEILSPGTETFPIRFRDGPSSPRRNDVIIGTGRGAESLP